MPVHFCTANPCPLCTGTIPKQLPVKAPAGYENEACMDCGSLFLEWAPDGRGYTCLSCRRMWELVVIPLK